MTIPIHNVLLVDIAWYIATESDPDAVHSHDEG